MAKLHLGLDGVKSGAIVVGVRSVGIGMVSLRFTDYIYCFLKLLLIDPIFQFPFPCLLKNPREVMADCI